jgi:hypothetical protein
MAVGSRAAARSLPPVRDASTPLESPRTTVCLPSSIAATAVTTSGTLLREAPRSTTICVLSPTSLLLFVFLHAHHMHKHTIL